MQVELLEKARTHRNENTFEIDSYEDFKNQLETKGGFFVTSFCLDKDLERQIKTETKATIRCILLDDKFNPIKSDKPCFISGKKENCVKVIFARSY